MLLVDMTPEEIRDVFTNHSEDLDRLEHAIQVALDKLEWIERRGEKAKSPYSISKLTAGLPEEERDRVVDHAIRVSAQVQRRRMAEAARDAALLELRHAGKPSRRQEMHKLETESTAQFVARMQRDSEAVLRARALEWELAKAQSELDALRRELKEAKAAAFIKRVIRTIVPWSR